jgi:cytochrome c553
MKNSIIALAVVGAFCLTTITAVSAAPPAGKSQAAKIARGEYIVKGVGMCGDCHSQFTPTGGFVMDKWLQGKKLEFNPAIPIPIWADTSPNIAGLPGWETQKAVQFLMTGLAPNGQPARPPMPGYRMNRADAEAVVAYLKSLKPPAGKLGAAAVGATAEEPSAKQ